jgi:hypothetical protein
MLNTGTDNYIVITFFDSFEKYVSKCESKNLLCKSFNKLIIFTLNEYKSEIKKTKIIILL